MFAFVALGAQEQQLLKWILNYKENKERRARGTQAVLLRVSLCLKVSQKVTADTICRAFLRNLYDNRAV